MKPIVLARLLPMLAALILACVACSRHAEPVPEQRVLFVGNSLVYVGNLPAVYAALATANGQPTRSDMIVRGGATLSQRVADGTVAQALANGDYDVLVLQERGGDLLCGFGPEACEASQAALASLAALADQHGARAVLLGTYQADPGASRRLVEAEAAAARRVGIAYVEVSETLAGLRRRHPGYLWFDADGMHPGRDLALLNAMQLYQGLHGAPPAAAELTVTAPIYAPTSGLDETLRAADAAPPLPETPRQTRYARETLESLLPEPGTGARP